MSAPAKPAPFRVLDLALVLMTIIWFESFAPWPDDWDGLGFLASVHRFDLARFAPHPPGYPVYVALLRFMSFFGDHAIVAASLVAMLSGGAAFVTLYRVIITWTDGKASQVECALVSAFVCSTPLAFHTVTVVGSEAPAMACAALALRGVTSRGTERRRILLVAIGVGLGLGVRLSWAPFLLPFLFLVARPLRVRTAIATTIMCLAWALPLAFIAGPATLVTLLRTHFGGHFARFGGSILTDTVRTRFFLRDILIDGLGGSSDRLGLAILLLFFTLLAIGAVSLQAGRRRAIALGAVVIVPYAVWIFLGQNLREQPRHALPIVLALTLFVATLPLSRQDRQWSGLVWVLMGLVVIRTGLDARARHAIAPPGVQLLAYVRDMTPPPRWVVTGQSARFFDGTEWASRTVGVSSLGEAVQALSRRDDPLGEVLITNEVEGVSEDTLPLTPLVELCRPARLDRRMPCMTAYSMNARSLLQR